jgi:TPR repeat protein
LDSCVALALNYENGRGVERNKGTALALFKKGLRPWTTPSV